jgi:uncharacterized protein YecE (DUF72 family)
MLEAGKFGALLLQFPWSFRDSPANRDYVASLCARFARYPLVLEVRHASWAEPGVLDWLPQLSLGLCNIDQPLFSGPLPQARSPPPPSAMSGCMGATINQSWFRENKFVGERYDYLYSVDELDPWLDRIKTVERAAEDTYVVR